MPPYLKGTSSVVSVDGASSLGSFLPGLTPGRRPKEAEVTLTLTLTLTPALTLTLTLTLTLILTLTQP